MYNHLKDSKNILITGCGGGYDIFCGLDIFFNLLEMEKNVVLGNYTFTHTDLLDSYGDKISNYCYKIKKNIDFNDESHINKILEDNPVPPSHILNSFGITREDYIQTLINPNSLMQTSYFPEYRLAKTLYEKYGLDVPVYCFESCGIKYLIEAYDKVVELEGIDTIILIDGGTDSLMTGLEKDSDGDNALGTPFEDVSSIVALSNLSSTLNIKNKYLYCIGYNIDRYHGVQDKDFLKNTAKIISDGGFIGSYMLNKHNTSTKKYIETFMDCCPENSIVNSHIIASITGHYGDYKQEHIKHRLGNSEQYIHPLMGLYWIYDLKCVYDNLKYDVDKLKVTEDEFQVSDLLKIE